MTSKDITIFRNNSETQLQKFNVTLEKINQELIGFGLTKSQVKVFVYLGKYGSNTASDVAKSLSLPRTETYQIINSLQNLGLIVAELAHPTKYTAIDLKKAVEILIHKEQTKVNALADKEEMLSTMWEELPFFAVETDESKTEKMQMIHGTGPIMNKIQEMINSSVDDFKIFGSLQDVMRFYHSDVFEWTDKSKSLLKLLITSVEKPPEFISEINSDNIRTVANESNKICFLINDSKQVLIFMRNATHPTKQVFAWWSDSESLIGIMDSLFELSWEKSTLLK
ncbi:TrmB family transcriptional regulator [Nitrosopumilus sp.]|uniref:TrmB family transcriptional regulator n=1 Tax=Nitrosopumilus sp. TaxID=2024843 RepID=UPI0026096D98|nr:helix-turn-helix domain-containing protein [Nitrosopumilus sp.]